LILNARGIARIGRPATIDGEAEAAQFDPAGEGVTDLAIGLAPDMAAFRRIPARSRKAGRVVARAGGATLAAANRVDPAFQGLPALALFPGIPPREGVVAVVEGEGWAAEQSPVVAGAALRVAPTATLAVRWSFGSNTPDLAHAAERSCPKSPESAGDPDVPEAKANAVTLSIHRCPGLQLQHGVKSVRLGDCSLIGLRTLEENALVGSARFDGVDPGIYLLRLSWLDLPPAFQTIEVRNADERAAIDLALATVFGKVTYGDAPFFGRVGVGLGAVTDESTGEYIALMHAPKASDRDLPPGFVQAIELTSCDRALVYRHLPEQAPLPNARLDIEIPENTARVQVLDAETAMPVANAVVSLAALIPGQREAAHYTDEIGKTGADGIVAATTVPANRELRICARHEQYLDACGDPFKMGERRTADVSVRLARAHVGSGRVIGAGPFASAEILWYSPDGRRIEVASVAADGSFQSKRAHQRGEIVVFVSASHPLLLTTMPFLEPDQPFDLPLPAVRSRTVEVTIGEAAAERIGFASFRVGGVPVPLYAITQHNIRQRKRYILNPGPLVLGPIYETAPLEIVFGPMTGYFWPRRESAIDPFYLPEAATLARVPLGERSSVTVGE
jgi:hypothetical protein